MVTSLLATMTSFKCLLLALFVTSVHGLQLTRLKIPAQVDIREEVTLICEFDLDGLGLYSIKWYKDEFEFYRYMPDNRPPDQSFPVIGVTLSGHRSNMSMTIVRLKDLSFNSSGTYRCEVSAEAPSFQTVIDKSNMTVMALPDHDPLIEGIRTEYSVGDYVIGNCTSARSNPVGALTWFINGNKAEDWLLVQYPSHVENVNNIGVYTRSLGLRFQSFKQHFMGSGLKMKLSCIATIGERSWQRTVISTISNNLTNQKLAQEQQGNTATSVTSCICLVVMPMTSYVLS